MPTIRFSYTSGAALEDVLDIHFGTANVTEMLPGALGARCNSDEAVLEGVLVSYRFRIGIIPFRCTMRYVNVDPEYGYTVILFKGPVRRYSHHVGITQDKVGGVNVFHRVMYSYKKGLRGLPARLLLRPALVRRVLRSACRRMDRILADAVAAKEAS